MSWAPVFTVESLQGGGVLGSNQETSGLRTELSWFGQDSSVIGTLRGFFSYYEKSPSVCRSVPRSYFPVSHHPSFSSGSLFSFLCFVFIIVVKGRSKMMNSRERSGRVTVTFCFQPQLRVTLTSKVYLLSVKVKSESESFRVYPVLLPFS